MPQEIESKVYLVKLLHSGETLLFRGKLDPNMQLLTADATVYTLQMMMDPTTGHPAVVPTPNWVLGAEIKDLSLHLPTQVIYYTADVPADLAGFYLQRVSGIITANSVPKNVGNPLQY